MEWSEDQSLKTNNNDVSNIPNTQSNKRKCENSDFFPESQSKPKYIIVKSQPQPQPNSNMAASTATIPTNNRFSPLTDNIQEVITTNTQINRESNNTKKIPPIVTIDLSYTQIKILMSLAKVEHYYVKYMSIGIKLLFTNLTEYTNAKKILTQQKKNFYTHDLPDEKTLKFVLSGLHDLSPNEIKNGLVQANLNPIEVKKMNIKNNIHPKPNQSCLYLVYFSNESKMKLSDLKNHKYVMNAVIKWSPYIHSRNGPTQCSRCQRYGHGNKNCQLQPRCKFCVGQHESSKCELIAPPSTSTSTSPGSTVPIVHPICCLCNGNHTANDKECPKRMEFITMRLESSKRTSPNRYTHHPSQQAELSRDQQLQQYPQLKPKNLPLKINQWTPNIANSPFSFSKILENQNQQFDDVNQNPNLFSVKDLLQLSNELIESLSSCKTKTEQFKVVTELTIKFLYTKNV